jgi:spore maturation protein CgeB
VRIFAALPRSAWVDLNLRCTLEEMGHTLVRFEFPGWPDETDPLWQRVEKPRTNERLLDRFRAALKTGDVDLFYAYLYSSVVYPETIDLIRQSGVPTVNFSCNNVHQFGLVEAIAPRFDVCVVPEKAALEAYRAVGARPVRIQLAANPRVYRPYAEPRRYDVTFVGQRYADRADFLLHLHRHSIQVRAWGAGWQARKRLDLSTLKAGLALIEDEGLYGLRRLVRTRRAHATSAAQAEEKTPFGGPRLRHPDLVRTFSQSRISLGFATAGDSHAGPKRLTHLRLREFEAPMSGALYLTERQDELAEYFCVGQEVLAYTDRDDLLDQVRHYLAHPEQAERVRRAGRHRALRDHTWQHRFRDLFTVLGIEKP